MSDTTRRYGASRIPAGSTVEDWPFGIDEIERYYDIAERELGVSGKAGNVDGKIDRRGNIFEAARRREYPMPPLRWTDWHEKMAAAARTLGWNPFPGPAAINTRTYDNRPGLRVPRFLRPRRLSRQCQRLDRRHDDSESSENRESRRRHRSARHRR